MIDYDETIDEKTFKQFSDLIYGLSGIVINDKKKALLQARLIKRMRRLGLSRFKEYLQYVNTDQTGDELVALLDVISTNVTHFFREPEHFRVLGGILRELERKGQRRIRIWCAASSTGEEPYSLAITAHEALHNLSDVKILATDICTTVLDTARRGIYTADQVANLNQRLLSRYFTSCTTASGADWQANSSIRDLIRFSRLNLAETPYPLNGPIDVIFCRNVMIYFDNTMRAKVLDEFVRLLRPGGYLVVGHAESLAGSLAKELTATGSAVYRK